MAIKRNGYTCLLAMQVLVSSICSLGGCPAIQLSLSTKQNICNGITACQVKQNINGEQNTDILRETEQTCSWAVGVPTTNKFVAFANKAESTVSTGQKYRLCHCTFVYAVFII